MTLDNGHQASPQLCNEKTDGETEPQVDNGTVVAVVDHGKVCIRSMLLLDFAALEVRLDRVNCSLLEQGVEYMGTDGLCVLPFVVNVQGDLCPHDSKQTK